MSCTGSRYDIELEQGSYYSLAVLVSDSTGAPINLSGYSGYAPIKAGHGSSGVLGAFDVSFNLPYESGQITLSMEPSGTAALPVIQGVYELEIYPPNGHNIKYLRGYAIVCPQVSF